MPPKNPTTRMRRPKSMCPSCGQVHTDGATSTCSNCREALGPPNRTRRITVGPSVRGDAPSAPKRPRIRRDPGTLIVRAIRADGARS